MTLRVKGMASSTYAPGAEQNKRRFRRRREGIFEGGLEETQRLNDGVRAPGLRQLANLKARTQAVSGSWNKFGLCLLNCEGKQEGDRDVR